MKRYALYGLDLASAIELSHHVPELESVGEPDVVFELADVPASSEERAPDRAEEVYRSPERLPTGESILTAARCGTGSLLTYHGEARFRVAEARILGEAHPPSAGWSRERTALLELRLLGPILAFWLERSGSVTLHASAVSVDGVAIGFLSSNRGGKTALAAALLAEGALLLSDDLLAVDRATDGFRARPSYPQMRMWPADARRFAGAHSILPRVHPELTKRRVAVGEGGFGEFDGITRPLHRVYLPERRPGVPVEVTPVGGRDALIALVRHSFLSRLVAAMGWEERRLDLLARVVASVPVRRLTYPSGHEHLPAVARAVLDDLERS